MLDNTLEDSINSRRILHVTGKILHELESIHEANPAYPALRINWMNVS